MHPIKTPRAFTLVELAIVLVVIGLLTGGAMTGASLIRQAQVRALSSEVNSYRSAVDAFITMYGASPGDMPNATAYWSTAYNGNGDGDIPWPGEGITVWQHLALAGLIPGSYPGSTALSGFTLRIGQHVPISKLRNAGYHFTGATLEIGAERSGDRTCTNMMSGPEALAIDSKIDDGKPTTGQVLGNVFGYSSFSSITWSGTSCYSGTAYLTTGTSTQLNACRLGFTNVWR